jgi:formylglycine-generating enzyme required for sulfatase activity
MTRATESSAKITVTNFSPPPSGGDRGSWFRPIWLLFGALGLTVAWILFFFVTAVSLRVTTLPADAQVILEGGFKLPVGEGYLARPGEYRLTANAEGYYPSESSISLDESRDIQIELSPLPGSVEISVTPETVTMLEVGIADRLISGPSPLLIEELAQGTYTLTLDADLYAEQSLEVEVRGLGITEQIDTELEPAWANVRLQSSPAEADVYNADGELLGQTPLELRLEEGSRRLRFAKQGYQTRELELDMMRGQRLAPSPVQLLPVESSLSLTSQPLGAAVIIDGQYRGETPLQISLLPDRDYQLRLFKAGFSAHESQIRLNRGEERQINPSLDQVTGELAVNVSPEDAEIWVDGDLVAEGSTNLTLSTVNHRIEVRKDGYQSQTREFLPLQNQQQSLSFNLLTESQAIWAGIPRRYEFSGHQMLLFRDAGTVRMGSSRREADRRANEAEWTADLQRAFYVSNHEVTNSQYRRFDQEHSSGNYARMSLDGSAQPVVGITWQEAALYCNWLSEQAGLEPFYQTVSGFVSGVNPDSTGYRLLTEAEWTWVAKVTSSQLERTYPWGNEPEPRPVGNFAGQEIADELNFTLTIEDGYPVTAPVGSFPPNDKGLYDIGGNVAEYLHDWYAVEAPSADVLVDPLGPDIGEYHVIRGGSWSRGYLPQLRLAYRDYDAVGRNDVGFRIARYAR